MGNYCCQANEDDDGDSNKCLMSDKSIISLGFSHLTKDWSRESILIQSAVYDYTTFVTGYCRAFAKENNIIIHEKFTLPLAWIFCCSWEGITLNIQKGKKKRLRDIDICDPLPEICSVLQDEMEEDSDENDQKEQDLAENNKKKKKKAITLAIDVKKKTFNVFNHRIQTLKTMSGGPVRQWKRQRYWQYMNDRKDTLEALNFKENDNDSEEPEWEDVEDKSDWNDVDINLIREDIQSFKTKDFKIEGSNVMVHFQNNESLTTLADVEITPNTNSKSIECIKNYLFTNYGAAIQNNLNEKQNIYGLSRLEKIIRRWIDEDGFQYYLDIKTLNASMFLDIKRQFINYPNINLNMACLLQDHPEFVEWAFEGCEPNSNNKRYNFDFSPVPMVSIPNKINYYALKGGMPQKQKAKKKNKKIYLEIDGTEDEESESQQEQTDDNEDEYMSKNRRTRKNHNISNSNDDTRDDKWRTHQAGFQPLGTILAENQKRIKAQKNASKKSSIVVGVGNTTDITEALNTNKRHRNKSSRPASLVHGTTGLK